MIGIKRELIFYETRDGKRPFQKWIEGLENRKGRIVTQIRLDRLEHGNAGAHRPVGGGVYELKIDFGPGFRIYFGQDGKLLIILLCGGDKASQNRDIQKAREYWRDYKERR